MSRGDDDGFLSRWSRAKRAARDAPPGPDGPEPPEPAPPDAPAAPDDDRSDAEILEDLGLKHPDLLEPGDDFAGFLQGAVPEHLRRRALRRLWRSNPVLANLDGLNDYDTDFTGDTVAPGMLQTAYKVGQGILRDATEARAERADDPAQPPETEEPPAQDAPAERLAEVAESSAPEGPRGTEQQNMQENAARPARARMRFRF